MCYVRILDLKGNESDDLKWAWRRNPNLRNIVYDITLLIS